jgi:hypothetical protein
MKIKVTSASGVGPALAGKGPVQARVNLRQMSFLRSVLKKIEPLSSRFA